MPMDIRTYLGGQVQRARKACKLTQQELSDQTGVSIKMIQCIENGSVNPSYEILFPIVNRLGLTTSNLFNVEPDEHEEEINRFLGKFRACNRANQMVLLNTLDFLAEQLLTLQDEKTENSSQRIMQYSQWVRIALPTGCCFMDKALFYQQDVYFSKKHSSSLPISQGTQFLQALLCAAFQNVRSNFFVSLFWRTCF